MSSHRHLLAPCLVVGLAVRSVLSAHHRRLLSRPNQRTDRWG